MSNRDFDTQHLRGEPAKVAKTLVKLLTADLGQAPDGGGCKAFCSPAQFRDRGEDCSKNAVLVLVHDGGDLRSYCNWDVGAYACIEKLRACLRPLGYFAEQATCWYTVVYRLPT